MAAVAVRAAALPSQMVSGPKQPASYSAHEWGSALAQTRGGVWMKTEAWVSAAYGRLQAGAEQAADRQRQKAAAAAVPSMAAESMSMAMQAVANAPNLAAEATP